jgi:hypothetical protein
VYGMVVLGGTRESRHIRPKSQSAGGGGDGSAPSTFGTGRVCVASGCTTILSTYNPSQVCCLHSEGWTVNPPSRVRQRRERETVTRHCAADDCGHEFVTANLSRKYCSDRCRMRAFQTRRNASPAPAPAV